MSYIIGAAAKRTDLSTKTIRYYADIGLVTPEGRSDKGYRLYDDRALRRLILVRRARAFGFSFESCAGDARADCPILSAMANGA